MNKRKIDERELRLRFYPPDQLTHVYRVGLATGNYRGACLAAKRLHEKGHVYVEFPFLRWIFECGPMCPVCVKRLESEGVAREITPVSNTGVNSKVDVGP